MNVIRVSAVLMRDTEGRVLTVRKHGTSVFMLPGGKPEPGEDPAQTAAREFEEELGAPLSAHRLSYLGEFRAPAANEAGFDVVAQVYEHPLVHGIEAHAEIAELQWIDPGSAHTRGRTDLAPLNVERIFPVLCQREL